MSLLLLYFFLSIGFSFLCSILEAVLLSITPSYVVQQSQQGTETGQLLNKYKDDLDKPLSAILTLNTIAHTIGAIMVGVQASVLFGSEDIDLLGTGIHLSYEAIVAGLMTFFILVLSEIIPKTLGANNWRTLAPFTARALKIIIWILYPFVWMSKLITSNLKSEKGKSVLSRADFAAIASVGQKSGALDAGESEIITNLLNFERKKVRDIMTPRTVTYMIHAETKLEDYVKKPSITHSRIPVFGKDKDDVLGIVLKDEIYQTYLTEDGKNKLIKDIIRPARFISSQMKLHELFKQLTDEKQHLFMVRDEFGNVVGLVTMEDVFETLLGKEIVDESDTVVDLQELAKQRIQKK